jgi:hypothetical protein
MEKAADYADEPKSGNGSEENHRWTLMNTDGEALTE